MPELPPAKRRKLDLDTKMAELAAQDCIEANSNGRFGVPAAPKELQREEAGILAGIEKSSWGSVHRVPCMYV